MIHLFERAFSKLADARTSLEQLSAAIDAQEFRTAFNSFVAHARATTNALQKTGAHVDEFGDWYEERRDEMRGDPLLRFFHRAREAEFHKGESLLEVHDPDALIDGAYSTTRRVQRGTVYESSPYGMNEHPDVLPRPKFTVKNAPTQHLGKQIGDSSPITLCKLVFEYLDDLINQAEKAVASK